MKPNEKRALRMMLACWLAMVLMGMTYTALAQDEATPAPPPEVTAAPDDSGITIDNPEIVNIEQPPSAETNDYERWFSIIFGVGMIVITLAITFASAVSNKGKEETTKDLAERLEKSVPFEIVMALLGAGVKLTETKTDDEGLEKLKSTLGITKTQEQVTSGNIDSSGIATS